MTEALPIKRKIYVLDTNVLLHDPTALFKFEDNEVVIPLVVIEEVDTFKRDQNERGRNARRCHGAGATSAAAHRHQRPGC